MGDTTLLSVGHNRHQYGPTSEERRVRVGSRPTGSEWLAERCEGKKDDKNGPHYSSLAIDPPKRSPVTPLTLGAATRAVETPTERNRRSLEVLDSGLPFPPLIDATDAAEGTETHERAPDPDAPERTVAEDFPPTEPAVARSDLLPCSESDRDRLVTYPLGKSDLDATEGEVLPRLREERLRVLKPGARTSRTTFSPITTTEEGRESRVPDLP